MAAEASTCTTDAKHNDDGGALFPITGDWAGTPTRGCARNFLASLTHDHDRLQSGRTSCLASAHSNSLSGHDHQGNAVQLLINFSTQ